MILLVFHKDFCPLLVYRVIMLDAGTEHSPRMLDVSLCSVFGWLMAEMLMLRLQRIVSCYFADGTEGSAATSHSVNICVRTPHYFLVIKQYKQYSHGLWIFWLCRCGISAVHFLDFRFFLDKFFAMHLLTPSLHAPLSTRTARPSRRTVAGTGPMAALCQAPWPLCWNRHLECGWHGCPVSACFLIQF